jgi:hypothetical protein
MSMTRQVEAHRGDVVEVSGRRVGDPGRMGELLEVLGAPEHQHFLVRWEDGRESVFYPGEGTTIRHKATPARRRPRNSSSLR